MFVIDYCFITFRKNTKSIKIHLMAISSSNKVQKAINDLKDFEKVYYDSFEIMKIPEGLIYTRVINGGVGSSFFVPSSK